jgi:Ca2+-binding EF-hand superfamily protein
MDEDGDGGISQTEYVLFNLIARRAIDPEVVKQLKEQFSAMDVDGSGALEIHNFPTSVPKRLARVNHQKQLTRWDPWLRWR